MTGTIKSLPPEKSFGFITVTDAKAGDPEIFFHMSEVVGVDFKSLQPGDAVSFDTVTSEKDGRVSAVKVQLVG